MTTLNELSSQVRRFSEERDWIRFHDPKSLTLALVGEVGELAELLQWRQADEPITDELRRRLGEEIADVQTYLLRLADVLGLDLDVAVRSKLASSAGRFPAEEFRRRAPEKF